MHQKIIFVNGFLFPGTYPGGEGYWQGAGSAFVTAAHNYLGCDLSPHFTDIQHPVLSRVSERIQKGHLYARQHYASLTTGLLKEQDQFTFVTHSMGAAFAEGMIACLQENGHHIGHVIHFNAFQAADIQISKSNSRSGFVIDYQNTNDPLINNAVYAKAGDIKNVSLKIREQSKKQYFKRHRDPIDSGDVWQILMRYTMP
jgi:hypothetical protein